VPVLVLAFVTIRKSQAQRASQASSETLGTIQTSCRPDVQVPFNRAVAFLHSFEFGKPSRV
jgi:hypothetical protein